MDKILMLINTFINGHNVSDYPSYNRNGIILNKSIKKNKKLDESIKCPNICSDFFNKYHKDRFGAEDHTYRLEGESQITILQDKEYAFLCFDLYLRGKGFTHTPLEKTDWVVYSKNKQKIWVNYATHKSFNQYDMVVTSKNPKKSESDKDLVTRLVA